MLSWFRRGGAARPVLGLADDAPGAASVRDLAAGLGVDQRLTMHDSAATLLADPACGQAGLLLVAVRSPVELAARIAAARAPGAPGELAVLSETPLEQIALRDLDASLQRGVFRVRPVSRTVACARGLFSLTAPPDRVARADHVAVLIAGDPGPLAAQLGIGLLRLLQLPGLTAAITLVGTGMASMVARLREGLPELDECGRLSAAPAWPGVERPALILALDGAPDDATLRALDPSGVTPIVRPNLTSWRALGEAQADSKHDEVARSIHQLHLEERQAAGGTWDDQPSQRPWEDLPERFREASRHQASHILFKLRWAGARIGAATMPFNWTALELAALAEAEHGRWAAAARLEGWSLGPTRDDQAKRSPLLVPFDALSQDMRDLDALPVRAAPRHLRAPVRRDLIASTQFDADTPAHGFAAACAASLSRLQSHFEGRLVLRISATTALAAGLAESAGAAGVPFQLALTDEPSMKLDPRLLGAERIAIGAATRHLPAPLEHLRIAADGQVTSSAGSR